MINIFIFEHEFMLGGVATGSVREVDIEVIPQKNEPYFDSAKILNLDHEIKSLWDVPLARRLWSCESPFLDFVLSLE